MVECLIAFEKSARIRCCAHAGPEYSRAAGSQRPPGLSVASIYRCSSVLLHSGTAIRLRGFWHIKLQRFSIVGVPTGLSERLDHLAFVHEQERLKTTRTFLIIRLGFDCWIVAFVSNGQEIFTVPTGDVAGATPPHIPAIRDQLIFPQH